MKYIIQLRSDPDVFIADYTGDPGRTILINSARVYKTKAGALSALTQFQNKYNRNFRCSKIIEYKGE